MRRLPRLQRLLATLLLWTTFSASAFAGAILNQSGLNTELGTTCAAQSKASPCISPSTMSDLIASASPGLVVGSITAAGSSQGTATALTGQINDVTTVAANTGVILPTAVAGQIQRIFNDGANVLAIYPASGASIGSAAVNVSYLLAVNQVVTLVAMSATSWKVLVNPAVVASSIFVLIPIQGL